MVISNEFCNDNFRMYLRFQTDDDRKVNCSYSGIIRNDNKQKEQCDRRCRDRMVVGFITTYAINAYHH
jgi:hypothetical protein